MSIAWNRNGAALAAAPKRVVLDREQFVAACEGERARSERSGLAFSLLTFHFTRDDAADSSLDVPSAMARLEEFLLDRLRLIDAVGRLGDDVVAALLPYTNGQGAAKVAGDGLSVIEELRAPPGVRLFVYPWVAGEENTSAIDAPSSPGAELRPENMETLFCRTTPRWKRGIDLVGAAVAALAAAPVLAAAAAAVRASSPGPVFFAQRRTGVGGRPFVMYKLRTMYADAEARRDELAAHNEQDGPAFKIIDDPRVTPVGRFLRKTSIDELPQLWNVLRGDMSLVGPRPLPCSETDSSEAWHRRRLDVTPGLTCTWQVRKEKYVPFEHWMRMDLAYVRNRGLLQDGRLLLKTIPTLLFRRTAS